MAKFLGFEIGKKAAMDGTPAELIKAYLDKVNNVRPYLTLREQPNAEASFYASLISMESMYQLAIYSDVLRIVFNALRKEIFRQGYEVTEKFACKCAGCGKEFDSEQKVCGECQSVLFSKPDVKQKEAAEAFLKRVNDNGQDVLQVSEMVNDDVETVDLGFMLMSQDYFFDEAGVIMRRVPVELIRVSPLNMIVLADKTGRPGRSNDGELLRFCPQHRESLVNDKSRENCNVCGCELFTAYYKTREQSGQKTMYYSKNEVTHKSKYKPGFVNGVSPLYGCWMKVVTLMNMDAYMKNYYSKQRPPRGLLFVKTANMASLEKMWNWALDQFKKNPHQIPPIGIEDSTGNLRGKMVEFIDFMRSLDEMQFIEVRNEFRRQIGANYGVSPIFQNDAAQSGGLNNESVMPDIPVMVRKFNKFIDFVPIASLHHAGNAKVSIFGLKDYEAFTYSGWSPILKAYRHKVKTRDVFEINTEGGFTAVTEDHSLFSQKKEVLGKNVKVDDSIDMVVPEYKNNESSLTEEVAWAIGLFIAEGTSAKRKNLGSVVVIYNQNKELLYRAKKALDGFFGVNGSVIEYKNSNGNLISKYDISRNAVYDWVSKYCYVAYDAYIHKNSATIKRIMNEKKVPIQILNATEQIKKAFLEGYWAGDGHIDVKGRMRCNTVSKTLASGLKYVIECLDFRCTVEHKISSYESQKNQIRLNKWKDSTIKILNSGRVKKIRKVKYTGDVYDIETRDHSFCAGVGYLMHHNSQQIVVTNRAVFDGQGVYNDGFFPWILENLGVTDFVLKLVANERQDEKALEELRGLRIRNAQTMQQLGFSITLNEDEEFEFSPLGQPVGGQQQNQLPFGNQPQLGYGASQPAYGTQPDRFGSEGMQSFSGMPSNVSRGSQVLKKKEEISKVRVYVKPGDDVPEGTTLRTGPRGGEYYETKAPARQREQLPEPSRSRSAVVRQRIPKDVADAKSAETIQRLLVYTQAAFGSKLTTDPREAGFVLADGTMPMMGARGQDKEHKIAGQFIPEEYKVRPEDGGVYGNVNRFLDMTGAIRVQFGNNESGIHFVKPPNAIQMKQLQSFFSSGKIKFPLFVDMDSAYPDAPEPLRSGEFRDWQSFRNFVSEVKREFETDEQWSEEEMPDVTYEEHKILQKFARRNGEAGEEISFAGEQEIKTVVDKGHYALISAGRNNNDAGDAKLSDEQIKARDAELASELANKGYKFTRIVGKYGAVEDSFLVMTHNPDEADIVELGKRFKQNSVLFVKNKLNKLVYTSGENVGKINIGKGYQEMQPGAKDDYTEIKWDGKSFKYSANLDFNTYYSYDTLPEEFKKSDTGFDRRAAVSSFIGKVQGEIYKELGMIEKAVDVTPQIFDIVESSLYDKSFEGTTKTISDKIKDLVVSAAIKGMSRRDLAEKIVSVSRGSVDEAQAEVISQTEFQAAANKIRELTYSELDPEEENTYRWLNPQDRRTTPICHKIVERTKKGVNLEKLKEIVKEESIAGGFDGSRDFSPHVNCRSTFVKYFR